jgi:hypothetical protein
MGTGFNTVDVRSAIEYVTVPMLLGTVAALEEAFRIKSLVS